MVFQILLNWLKDLSRSLTTLKDFSGLGFQSFLIDNITCINGNLFFYKSAVLELFCVSQFF